MKLFLILLLVASFSGYSQETQKQHLELSLKDVDNYKLVPIAEQGFVVFFNTNEKQNNSKVWKFVKYNSEFKEVSSQSFNISKENPFLRSYIYDAKTERIYILFVSNKLKKCYIMYFNVENNKIDGFQFDNYKDPIGFDLIGGDESGCLYSGSEFGYYFAKSNFESKSTNIQPIFVRQKDFDDMLLDYDTIKNNNVIILFKNLKNRHPSDFIVTYDYKSQAKPTIIPLEVKTSKSIMSTKLAETNNSTKIAIGTYIGIDNENLISQGGDIGFTLSSWDEIGGSQGFYFSKLIGEKQTDTKYYSFLEFKSLKESINREHEKIVDKKILEKIKLRESAGFYKIKLLKVFNQNDNFIAIAEAYFPTFKDVTSYNSRKDEYVNRGIFEGYLDTHTIVVCFNKNGDLLWEQSFEMYDLLNFHEAQQVNWIVESDGSIVFTYTDGKTVTYNIIKDGNFVLKNSKYKMETKFGEKNYIKSVKDNATLYWYGKNFISYGIKEVIYDKVKFKARDVFCVDKITQ